MFYYEIPWFYQYLILQVKTCVLQVNTGLITRGHVKSPQMRNKTPFLSCWNMCNISLF